MCRDSRDDCLNSCIIMLHLISFSCSLNNISIAILATSCVHI